MKIVVVDFVGIIDGSLSIGCVAIGDHSNGTEYVVVVFVVIVVVVVVVVVEVIVFVVIVVFVVVEVIVVVFVALIYVMKVKMANSTYSSVS